MSHAFLEFKVPWRFQTVPINTRAAHPLPSMANVMAVQPTPTCTRCSFQYLRLSWRRTFIPPALSTTPIRAVGTTRPAVLARERALTSVHGQNSYSSVQLLVVLSCRLNVGPQLR